jgi:hypothetical protein
VETLSVYCTDVGSIKQGNCGWARAEVPTRTVDRDRGGGTEIAELVNAISDDLASGVPVALGFECPVFVPVPQRLGAARPGEGGRSFSAGLESGVAGAAYYQQPYVGAEEELPREVVAVSAALE